METPPTSIMNKGKTKIDELEPISLKYEELDPWKEDLGYQAALKLQADLDQEAIIEK